MLAKSLLTLALVAAGTVAAAADTPTPAIQPANTGGVDPAAAKVVGDALKRLSSQITVDSIAPAKLPGFYQVIASGRLVYVSHDGKYLLNGDLIDLGSKDNLSEAAWASFRKAELAKLPQAQRIVFAPPNPKYTVTVFTDVNCAYCRAFHENIGQINKDGIAVEYIAWPREGVETTAGNPTATYKEMVSVWCAADRKAAFTAAKQGKTPKATSCANPVKDEFNLGLKLGVNGTPTVIAPDGRVIGGFVPPDKLLAILREGSAAGG